MNTSLRAIDPEIISAECWAAVANKKHREAQAEASDASSFRRGLIHACRILNDRLHPGSAAFLERHRDWQAVYQAVKVLQGVPPRSEG